MDKKFRVSPYVPNKPRNKRWMQLDANQEYLSIAMDHSAGDISAQDIGSLNLLVGPNGSNSSIMLSKNNDAVNLSIFISEPYDFTNENFVSFLEKHYQSYLKRVGLQAAEL